MGCSKRQMSHGRVNSKFEGNPLHMILLTGFEPFTTGQGLELTHNPTAEIAMSVAASVEGVRGAVLPVSFERTRACLTDHLNQIRILTNLFKLIMDVADQCFRTGHAFR